MATEFFSGKWIGTWAGYAMTGKLTGDVSRSGNTVTLYNLNVSWTAPYGSGSDSGAWFAVYEGRDGQWQLVRGTGLSMSGGSGNKWLGTATSITVGASDISHYFTFKSSDGAKIEFTVSFPSGQTEPATPTISAVLNADETVSVTWGTTNLGNPTGTVYLYNGTTSSPANQISSKTTTGNSTYNNTGLTANTTYYYKATASNTVGSASSSVVNATTYPAGVTSFTVDSVTSDSVTVTVVYEASGNALATAAECRINDSGTWDTIDTDMQGTTKTYTLGPFFPETTNTVEIRVSTTVGNSPAASVTFTTLPPVKFYGSINGSSKRIEKLYGSVNGQTKTIKKVYASVNGQTKLIYRG